MITDLDWEKSGILLFWKLENPSEIQILSPTQKICQNPCTFYLGLGVRVVARSRWTNRNCRLCWINEKAGNLTGMGVVRGVPTGHF